MPLHLLAMIALAVGPYGMLEYLVSYFSPSVRAREGADAAGAGPSHGRGQGGGKVAGGLYFAIAVIVCGVILWRGCMSHPFLLADNR